MPAGARQPSIQAAFWAKVSDTERADRATPNSGQPDAHGYSRVVRQNRTYVAHRVSDQIHHGPVPAGLVVDRTCRNRFCVNTLRGIAPNIVLYLSDACKRGHPLHSA